MLTVIVYIYLKRVYIVMSSFVLTINSGCASFNHLSSIELKYCQASFSFLCVVHMYNLMLCYFIHKSIFKK